MFISDSIFLYFFSSFRHFSLVYSLFLSLLKIFFFFFCVRLNVFSIEYF